MSENPLISVVVPVYNVAPYLERCIDSILHQTFQAFELILVDDGSTDTSPSICDRYAAQDERVKVIHQPNAGVSSARNRGMAEAQGEYLSFVDADDWVEPTFLQVFAEEVEKHGGVDMVIQGFVDHEGKPIRPSQGFYNASAEWSNRLYDWNENHLIGYVWNKLFRRELITEYKHIFDASIPMGEDFLFCMSFLCHVKRLSLVDVVGYHYIFSGDKWYSFHDFDKRLELGYTLLQMMTFLPEKQHRLFAYKEFHKALYALHILYGEHQPRIVRIGFLEKHKKRIGKNRKSCVAAMEQPYKTLAAILLYLPVPVGDIVFSVHSWMKSSNR